MSEQTEKGGRAEDFVARWLQERGWVLLARNFRGPFGEIDLIAREGDTLCFVEVKARRRGSLSPAEWSVPLSKRKKLIATAMLYLQQQQSPELQPRFDVACLVLGGDGGTEELRYLKGAFDSDGKSL